MADDPKILPGKVEDLLVSYASNASPPPMPSMAVMLDVARDLRATHEHDVATLLARIRELEALVAQQRAVCEAARVLLAKRERDDIDGEAGTHAAADVLEIALRALDSPQSG